MVLLAHSMCAFWAGNSAVTLCDHNCLHFVTSGHLAVLIFFVISGYVLTVKYVHRDSLADLPMTILSRYPRLVLPIFCSCLLAFVLLWAGLFHNLQMADKFGIKPWLGIFYTFKPNVWKFLRFSFFDVFFAYDGMKSYNTNLWTMPGEYLGSLFIFAYLAVFKYVPEERQGTKMMLHAIVLAALWLTNYPFTVCFVLGYLIARYGKCASNRAIPVLSSLLFAAAVWIATYKMPDDDRHGALLAAAIALAAVNAGPLRWALRTRLSQFFGRISFPLYLMQILVICSYTSYAGLWLDAHGYALQSISYILAATTVALSIAAAVLFYPVERASIRLSKALAQALLNFDPLLAAKHIIGRVRGKKSL